MIKAVVLLSGGLDSAVTLYLAKARGFKCYCLTFDYGQRHKIELQFARRVAASIGASFKIIKMSLPWQGSSLLDKSLRLPASRHREDGGIPSTYVPGRNIIFLSFALSYAETIGAQAIFIGAHAQDYSGYPDCRPEFFRAFAVVAAKGTKSGVESGPVKIVTPLLGKTKAGIIRTGVSLGVPFGLTRSCYAATKKPCGSCDSCYYRIKGFKEAGIEDPAFKL